LDYSRSWHTSLEAVEQAAEAGRAVHPFEVEVVAVVDEVDSATADVAPLAEGEVLEVGQVDVERAVVLEALAVDLSQV
jgi:hypothetical protein